MLISVTNTYWVCNASVQCGPLQYLCCCNSTGTTQFLRLL